MFSWISRRKPGKATTEDKGRCSSSGGGSSNLSNDKFNMIDHHNFHNSDEVVASQRRDIVKIFVNYEEYGLLAIGTLGYDPSSGMEPEVELFEIRPGALEEVRQQQEESKESSSRVDNDQMVLAPRLAAKKKVFPLEGLIHIPHIGAGLLKSSRLVDRLLHPSNYLGSRSCRRGSGSLVPRKSEESRESRASVFRELLNKGLRINSWSKDRRHATSSEVKLQITLAKAIDDELGAACSKMRASPSAQKTKVKKKESEDWKPKVTTMTAMARLLCAASVNVDDEDDEEDNENNKDKDDGDNRRDGGGGGKFRERCCQVAPTEDEKEYKIRTESEYVVLEL